MALSERDRFMRNAWHEVMTAYDGKQEMISFRQNCMRAIIGAAALLGRDPVALAELLSDGRLAEYGIRAAEDTIPLPLDDPAPALQPIRNVLEKSADRARDERTRLEKVFQRMLRELEETEHDLRRRANHAYNWESRWNSLRRDHERKSS